ncbi:T9SS-dependent choice-of-anchor J family protein [Flavobacterium sp.]|uniref:T9SS-dependent choice-of-anchor J family protein n=1 Tax=Flavobacterium sp. TaxID=239 RepID=UPI002B4B8424|nr:choice-of-anchor J domain-containing protein [Flavobacterium sp.]HLP65317.1 choice-of-anchor J domain-containing protein [Flavobacterium sp.]
MKKITISILLVLYSVVGFSQVLFESFENTTGPEPAPSTNWTLGSGNWAVFDTNVGGTVNWSTNIISNTGQKCAFMNRQNMGIGITTEEYLATPMITVPTNGKLEFYSRTFTAGNQGSLYQVKVAMATSPQNNPSSYTILLEEFGESQVSPAFNMYWKKTLDLSGFAGQNIYIAFVLKHTQPNSSLSGDRFLLDDVSVTDGTDCHQPSNFNIEYIESNSSYNLTWNTDNANAWEVLAIQCSQEIPFQNQSGIQTNTNTYNFSGLTEDYCYNFCVRRICDDGTTSNWSIITLNNANSVYNDYCLYITSFIDNNINGIYDVGDEPFRNGIITYSNNPEPIVDYTSNNYCSTPSNTADFEFQIMPEYLPYYSSTVSSYTNVSFNDNQNYYFPVTLVQPFEDLGVYGFNSSTPRAGFNYSVRFYYGNSGLIPTDGTINFTKDPQVSIVAVSLPTADYLITADGFSYVTNILQPGQGGYINVTLSVPPIPTVAIGDLLTNSVTITPNSGTDNILSNNSFSETKAIIAAYDPNNKTESHGGQIEFDQFTSNDYLYYTINFQNLGNASAIDVRIEDLLDPKIDESSFQMIESSHNYSLERNGSNLIWRFDNIQLLPSFVSEDLSKGFITFKVKPKPGYTVGDIIPNSAAIYFDTNPAIITNTFNTEFVDSLGNPRFDSNNVFLAPNPANETVQIQLQNTSETIKSITITDVLGKTIRTLKATTGNQISVNLADVSQGVYFVEIITQNGLKQTKKLIKE